MKTSLKRAAKHTRELFPEMLVCFLITYAAGCACLEHRLPDKLAAVYSGVMLAVCVITWIWALFVSGRRVRWQFVVYAALIWILPQVIMFITNEELHGARKDTFSFVLSEFCGIFSTALLERLFGWLSGNMLINSAAAAAVCAAAYICGCYTAVLRKKKNGQDKR